MPKSEQLNLRLQLAHRQQLEALAYLEGVAVTEMARRLIVAALKRSADQPAVRQAMEARARYEGEQSGDVRTLGGRDTTTP